MIFAIGLLAISLSLDALGVGLAYGLRRIKIPLIPKIFICIFSILYSGAALAIGKSLLAILPPYVSKLVGIVILSLMGICIVIQALLKNGDSKPSEGILRREDKTLLKIVIKSLGITIQVIKNPIKGDIDKSGIIDVTEALLLGLALSVDAIGVGIGSALAGFNSILIPFLVGLFQLVFLKTGLYLGGRLVSSGMAGSKVLSFLPGILLILLAVMRI